VGLHTREHPLSRSYGVILAEFLNRGSLVHLGLLDLPTCVGVRYGHLCLSTPGISCLPRCCSLAATRGWPLVLASRSTPEGISLPRLPTSVNGAHLAAEHPPQGSGRVQVMQKWSPTINGVSIAYGLRPRLRPDYPAAECPCGGTLRLSVGGVLAPRIVTHTDIRTCGRSTGWASAPASLPPQRSPTTGSEDPILRVGADLSPGGLSMHTD
jgi:hypothetical protein